MKLRIPKPSLSQVSAVQNQHWNNTKTGFKLDKRVSQQSSYSILTLESLQGNGSVTKSIDYSSEDLGSVPRTIWGLRNYL